ncbi:hypothetical protein BT63DRAFT_203991 [Microthyrium microscopicum]|uniref:Uncharacterized protein n=1 Tax=Microthyrium microscopicum TaxID=703497 RepID=A0A6A6UHL4_9PEZI|nr:hypothetical protein BT63DRAFT_203991 [Microthyrium microscopicum]
MVLESRITSVSLITDRTSIISPKRSDATHLPIRHFTTDVRFDADQSDICTKIELISYRTLPLRCVLSVSPMIRCIRLSPSMQHRFQILIFFTICTDLPHPRNCIFLELFFHVVVWHHHPPRTPDRSLLHFMHYSYGKQSQGQPFFFLVLLCKVLLHPFYFDITRSSISPISRPYPKMSSFVFWPIVILF